MPRGSLIFPFLVDIAQLDTAATAADPDAAGPATSGYDPFFREPIVVLPSDDSSAAGVPVRVENVVQLYAQIEPAENDKLMMMITGRSPSSKLSLVFHYADLERVGMVETATGRPKLRTPGDRLAAIRHPDTGELIEEIPASPGLFATEVQSIGFGMGPYRNLLLVTFEERALSTERTGAAGIG